MTRIGVQAMMLKREFETDGAFATLQRLRYVLSTAWNIKGSQLLRAFRVGVEARTRTHSQVSGAAEVNGFRRAWVMESAASVRLSPR